MGPGFGLAELIFRAAGDDLLLVIHIVGDQLFEVEEHRLAAGNRNHVDAEGNLQVGILVEVGEHPLGIDVTLELDHGAHAGSVTLIADVVDPAQRGFFLLAELEDLFQHGGFIDLVGNLGDDQQLAAGSPVLHMHAGAEGQLAAAGFIAAADLLVIHQDPAGREVRAGEDLHEIIQGDIRVVHLREDGADRFPQVMGGDVGGQADRDAVGTVDQQVGEAGGDHVRLFEGIVKVEPEGNGVLFNIPEHLHGQGRHAGFGVPHGGRPVPVDGAEVAVAVDHGAAHGEILRHMDQGAVDGGVSVGMVFTKAVAHDTGAFAVRLVRGGAQLHHGVQDAALDRLEAVLHAGEGTLQDDVLGVGHHAVVHDVLHVDIQNPGGIVLYDRLIVLLLRQGQFPPSCAARWLSGSSKLSGRLKSACSLI